MASLSDEKLWELIAKCDVAMLKSLLSKVAVPHQVVKDKLQKRLFYSIRLGLDVLPTQEEKDKSVAESHRRKLDLGSGLFVPHPLTIENWETSPANFPTVTDQDIEAYFDGCNTDVGIQTGGSKALSEGHSLFTSHHVQDVGYNKINDILGVCFIRGFVIPTMRLKADRYYVWAQIYKATGVIRIADCHCIAGVSSMCKHIASLLYHVSQKAANDENKPCTSVLQKWHKPASLKSSALLSDVKTPKATKRVCPKSTLRRDEFDPRPVALRRVRPLSEFDLPGLAEISHGKAAVLLYENMQSQASKNTCPNLMNVTETVSIETTVPVPSVYETFAHHQQSPPSSFVNELKFNALGLTEMEKSTKAQAGNEEWCKQRKGRLTASVMHTILSHVDDDGNITGKLNSVVERVMGYNDGFKSAATNHGRAGEQHVRNRYAKEQRKSHTHLKVEASGLWVSMEHPFIAASPDGLVRCDCCPDRILEIKCPYTHRLSTIRAYAQQGTVSKNSELFIAEGQVVFNKKHAYYSQVQTQLLCTGLSSCDLAFGTMSKDDNFVFFSIAKDETYCDIIKKKCCNFFEKVIFPELKSQRILKEKQLKAEAKKLKVDAKKSHNCFLFLL